MTITSLTLLCAMVAQQVSTMEYRSSTSVAKMMKMSSIDVSDDVLTADSGLVDQGVSSPAIRRVAKTEEQKREAATAAWAAARSEKGVGAKEVSLTASEYTRALESLGKLVITSEPSGASVTVDGFRWARSTKAEGFADAGNRKIVVSREGITVRVVCDVSRDGVTSVRVDLNSGAAECR